MLSYKRKKRRVCFLLCLVFTLCFSGAASAEGQLYDRNGLSLDVESFQYYDQATLAFSDRVADGEALSLTIDLALQEKTRELIGQVPDACAVVLDVNTGAPLALAYVGGADPLDTLYTPDGLFLPCTALAALSNDIIDVEDGIHCEGVFNRYATEGIAPECWIWNAAEDAHLTHGLEAVDTALRDNCQYYFYCLGNDLGIDAVEQYARSLGLGEESGIELPSVKGIVASRDLKTADSPWHIGDTLEAAVGRAENAFTALELARYCAAIANGGKLYSASILESSSDESGKLVYERDAVAVSQADDMAEYKWDAVRTGLYMCLNRPDSHINISSFYSGSLTMAGINGFSGGKGETGDALFMAYAPYYKPEIAIVVAINDAASTSPAQQIAWDIFDAYRQLC